MIKFVDVNLEYEKNHKAIDNLNLNVNDNEFLVIIGPSGCGKSSMVKMLAGLIKQTSGNIYIDDKLIDNIPSYNRGISFMQQNAKLYPHLSVFKNISLPLEMKKLDKNTIKAKVEEIAEMLSIKPYLTRMPKELSGGEYQRVNLARTLILDNDIVIFDEPLSSLDTNLKVDLRYDIKNLHKTFKHTTIYITHDQVEAMSLADRIVLMNEGKIVQIGTPLELYENPINTFSASFLSKMNYIKKDNYILGFRPSDVSLDGDILVKVIDKEIIGDKLNVYGTLDGEKIEFITDIHEVIGEEVKIKINKKYYFDVESKNRKEIDW